MKTFQASAREIKRRWYLVDAQGKILGRLATQVANLLRGKGKPTFTPFLDGGDHVVVINAQKVRLTGRKIKQKTYYWHSGYPGGLKSVTAEKMLSRHPERVVEHAVRGMLPKGKLGDALFRKLKVYAGTQHPHGAQQPETLELMDR
ncbi:MAG: 50S ribosomal protein L13 [candidate division NC10 bacterium]|nr:50S ribosomal protein L13 [candidate division NC10 bacterium]